MTALPQLFFDIQGGDAGISVADVNAPTIAGAIASHVPALPAETSCGTVCDTLMRQMAEPALAVVDSQGKPIGLVNRSALLTRYAQRYVPELYSRKPITELMNDRPLIVDEFIPIIDLGRQVAIEQPDALLNGFIITSSGRYLGMGTGQALIRYKVERDARRTKELKRALTAAAQSRKAMTEFLAMMSHELRTPLNAIIGFSDILRREQFGPLGQPRYVEYVTDIHNAGSHLLSLISDILDLSKAEAGRLDLRTEPLDMYTTVAACLPLVSERARLAGIRLRTEVPVDLPLLDADLLKVKQIILNLLSNAIKFTPSGGSVTLATELDGGDLRLSVTDTGIGIAAKDIAVALAPFGQIDSALARKSEGTGLGLPMVKALAELHGGQVDVTSEVGVGTTISVTFPRSRLLDPTAGSLNS